jgi:hypothetical protein
MCISSTDRNLYDYATWTESEQLATAMDEGSPFHRRQRLANTRKNDTFNGVVPLLTIRVAITTLYVIPRYSSKSTLYENDIIKPLAGFVDY